jgi:hypothetical protein
MAELGFIVNKIKWKENIMASICDEELINTIVKHGEVEMSISREYFGENKMDLEDALEIIRSSQIINLAGTRIVNETIRAKLASNLAVKKVGSTSFLMIFKF